MPVVHNRQQMDSPELSRLIEDAGYLLRVVALCDVESLLGQRATVLRKLREVEARAAQLGVSDLYGAVLQNSVAGRLQSSYGEA